MSDVNHILIVKQPDGSWMASVGRKSESGYSVEIAPDPSVALSRVLVKVGATGLLNPTDPLHHLLNALDRAIIARWSFNP